MNQRQDKDEIVINNDKDIEEARKYFRSKANFAQEIAILLDKYLPTYKYTKNKYIIIPTNKIITAIASIILNIFTLLFFFIFSLLFP